MKKFLNFCEARVIVRGFGLKSKKEWYCFIRGNKCGIPSNPNKIYRDQWISWLDWMGYKKKTMPPLFNRKHKVNEDFFKTWSEDMAYILGYWFADGCITKGDCWSISTKLPDKYILEKIADKMESEHKISSWRNRSSKKRQCALNIYSNKIVDDVKTLGGTERKSLTMKFPVIPPKFFPDFVRGYFDGDGCICYDKNRHYYVSTFISGSKSFVQVLLNKLKINYGLGGSVHSFKNKKNGNVYYRIFLNKNDTIKLKGIMYRKILLRNNGLMLKRKYNLFLRTGEISRTMGKDFLPYNTAQKYASSLGLRGNRSWFSFCLKNKPINIPFSPERFYKNKGWNGWKEWLGNR